MKDYIVHNSPSLCKSSINFIASFSVIEEFIIAALHFCQAYLQSSELLSWKIYVRPRQNDLNVLQIRSNMLLKLRKLLYGVHDSGDYRNDALHELAEQELKLKN